MNAGDLNTRVQLQRSVASKDALNQETLNWVNFGGRVWARVTPLSGRALQLANQNQELATYEVLVRYTVRVSKLHRILWRDKTLTIEAVQPMPEKDRQRVLCSEGTRDNTEAVRDAA